MCGEAPLPISSLGSPAPSMTPATSEWMGLMLATARRVSMAMADGANASAHDASTPARTCLITQPRLACGRSRTPRSLARSGKKRYFRALLAVSKPSPLGNRVTWTEAVFPACDHDHQRSVAIHVGASGTAMGEAQTPTDAAPASRPRGRRRRSSRRNRARRRDSRNLPELCGGAS